MVETPCGTLKSASDCCILLSAKLPTKHLNSRLRIHVQSSLASTKLLTQIRMSRMLVLLVVVAALLTITSAQFNFTPYWGKRGASQEGCKSSADSLMYLYKLIQNEAQKLVDCEKYGN